jgi:membrane-bound metal-dependent hydrolase YbcI (DUF457 family)
MDVGTHALASLALSRAIFPRAPKLLWVWTTSAGVIADTDQLSALISPSEYVAWYRTYTHSLVASFLIAAILIALYRACAPSTVRKRLPVRDVLIAVLLVQWLHLAMDAAHWQGVELLWPLNHARVAADWLPSIDPWIISILIAAIALPEFFHLVTAEIGAKDKKPRGVVGAAAGLTIVLFYVGLRAELHATAVAQLQNRVYVREMPRRVAAYCEFTSLVSWKGVAETESALHEVTVRIGSTRLSSLDTGVNLFKPEPSRLLQAAQTTELAKRFLQIARFPKATIQKMDSGSEVQIRDVRYAAAAEFKHEPMVAIDFDLSGKLFSEEIIWASHDTPR